MLNRRGLLRLQLSLIAGLVVFSSVITGAPAGAVDATGGDDLIESILLSPVSKRYSVTAGSTQTDTFKVINDGKIAYDFIVYARPYSVNDESYQPDFVSKSQNADAYKWVQFKQPSYRIEAGQTIDVQYTIRVPSGATPGGHYGVLFAETQPASDTEGNVVKRTKRVGAILYATVSGNLTRSGTLESVDVPFFQFTNPLTTAVRVKNGGNTDFVVKSSMKVSDMLGNLKFKIDREHTVLPSSTRRIQTDWPDSKWIGLYKVELKTSFLDTNKSSTHYVLMVPTWVYLTLVIVIGLRVAYVVARRRTSKKKA